MKRKTSDSKPHNTDELTVSQSMTPTVLQSMTPRSKTKLQITEAGLFTKQSSKVKKQLLLGNLVQSQLNSTRKQMRPSQVRMLHKMLCGRILKNIDWQRLSARILA